MRKSIFLLTDACPQKENRALSQEPRTLFLCLSSPTPAKALGANRNFAQQKKMETHTGIHRYSTALGAEK